LFSKLVKTVDMCGGLEMASNAKNGHR